MVGILLLDRACCQRDLKHVLSLSHRLWSLRLERSAPRELRTDKQEQELRLRHGRFPSKNSVELPHYGGVPKNNIPCHFTTLSPMKHCIIPMISFAFALAIVVSIAPPSQAFITKPTTFPTCSCLHRRSHQLYNYNDATSGGGGIEEIEFRIYPDGRVTEIVRGVKGKNCQSVTEAINKQLGNVVASSPTEEMFEEEVLVKTSLEQKEGWDGASSW